jgi:epoxyqueuosine reductase
MTDTLLLPSSTIKAEAHRLGFVGCGVARAGRVSAEEEQSFRQWLRKGHQADMAYMERYIDLRLDPRLLLPGAQTLVCLAMSYVPSHPLPDHEPQLATYALGKDYHDVVRQRLIALAHALNLGPEQFRPCVDTAPILERYWAEQSGLGFRGRNQQLIVPGHGSMCFLGELLVTLEADAYDAPMARRCGQCHRCVDACPTGALCLSGAAEDFDARRCLSYQTIENRGRLSPEAVQAMGDTIYGCDRCQQACPYNRHLAPTEVTEFEPSDDLLAMTRERWLHLTVADYRRLFKGSAVKRAKYEGLMRNIRAAIGNGEDAKDDETKTEEKEK